MKHLLIATVVFLGVAATSEAKEYPKLTEFVQTNIRTIGSTLENNTLDNSMDFGGKFEMKVFFLRLQAKVGFDVPGFNITLVPELELVFQKELVTPL